MLALPMPIAKQLNPGTAEGLTQELTEEIKLCFHPVNEYKLVFVAGLVGEFRVLACSGRVASAGSAHQ
jgi:hypothetical protein